MAEKFYDRFVVLISLRKSTWFTVGFHLNFVHSGGLFQMVSPFKKAAFFGQKVINKSFNALEKAKSEMP
jgi:hypothetical protein